MKLATLTLSILLLCITTFANDKTPELMARDFVDMVLDGTYDKNSAVVGSDNPEGVASLALIQEAREIVRRENAAGRPNDIIAAVIVTPSSLDLNTILKTAQMEQAVIYFVNRSESLK